MPPSVQARRSSSSFPFFPGSSSPAFRTLLSQPCPELPPALWVGGAQLGTDARKLRPPRRLSHVFPTTFTQAAEHSAEPGFRRQRRALGEPSGRPKNRRVEKAGEERVVGPEGAGGGCSRAASSVSPSPRGPGPAREFAPPRGEGAAGNGASLAPATSNPRLACEDNGCLIFSIRRAQCRILSFTRGGASEVISQRHSARTLPLCGGARAPAPRGLAAGRGVQLRPLQRGPAARPAVGTGAASLGSRPPARPRAAALGTPRSSRPGPAPAAACPGCSHPELGGHCRSPSYCHFHHDLEGFFLSSPGSQRARGWARGGGSGEERGGWELDTKR